jgi:hypothetical protein
VDEGKEDHHQRATVKCPQSDCSTRERTGCKGACGNIKAFFEKCLHTFRCLRKSFKSKQDVLKRQTKEAQLIKLWELYEHKAFDLFFGDESTLSIEPYLPYGWQPKGGTISILPDKDKKINSLLQPIGGCS